MHILSWGRRYCVSSFEVEDIMYPISLSQGRRCSAIDLAEHPLSDGWPLDCWNIVVWKSSFNLSLSASCLEIAWQGKTGTPCMSLCRQCMFTGNSEVLQVLVRERNSFPPFNWIWRSHLSCCIFVSAHYMMAVCEEFLVFFVFLLLCADSCCVVRPMSWWHATASLALQLSE